MKTFFKYFHNKQSRYISILLWAYEKRHIGFTKDELRSELSIFESEWPWVKWTFFGSLNGNSPLVWFISGEHMPDFQVDTQRFYLTPAGTSAAVDFLELQQAKRGGYIATAIGVVALLVSIVTGWLNYESLKVTQNSLELAAPTVLEIISDDTLFGVDQVKRAIGMIPAASSTAYFQLVNNSTPTIVSADIRMTLWAIDRAEGKSNFRLCPMGYVNHSDNPKFKVSDFRVDNVLNSTFTLKTGESYPFTFDYRGLGFTDFWGGTLNEKSSRFVKIDVIYKKKSGYITERYTKIFRIFNDESLIDVDHAPEFGSMIASGEILSRENPYNLPSVFYPFQNEEFVNFLRSLPRPDNMAFGECQKFEINKVTPQLSY